MYGYDMTSTATDKITVDFSDLGASFKAELRREYRLDRLAGMNKRIARMSTLDRIIGA